MDPLFIVPVISIITPNGSRLSRLAGCALFGSVYNKRHRRRHAPYLLAEGQVGSNRGLGDFSQGQNGLIFAA